MCTLQDSAALTARGHSVDVIYNIDGSLRTDYVTAGISLHGPHPFNFDPHRSLRDLAGYIPAARQTRRLRPDILWLNRPEHIIWGQAISRWARIPLVCHLHHHPNYNRLRLVNSGVSHFIAVSEFIRDEWVDRGLQPERVSVLHNAIAGQEYSFGGFDEQLAARRRLGLPEGVSVVLYYGRILAEKGLPTLLQAWRESRLTPEQAILVMVGSPSPQDDPEVAKELSRLPTAAYRWFPAQANVVSFLHAADLVVCPYWAPEPFGRVIIEAMSTGRPVVASQVGAVPEILTGKMARFLVPPRSPVELAQQLTSLLDWRRDQPDLGVECRKWVEDRFPYSRHVNKLESLLDQHRGRAR